MITVQTWGTISHAAALALNAKKPVRTKWFQVSELALVNTKILKVGQRQQLTSMSRIVPD